MGEGKEIAVAASSVPATLAAMNMIKERMNLVTTVYKEIMVDKQDFGTIPGCGDKPTLLKPGAEKLMMAFRIAATAEKIEQTDMGGGHRDYRVTVILTGQGGEVLGGGVGSCSTMESKYRYRSASRKCPACGKEAIIKGKEEYGGGWLCFKKKGGCGATWPDGAPEIEKQENGRIENPDPADQWNTVLKMAKKRALIDACLTALGASTMFTQDIEDMGPGDQPAKSTPAKPAESPAPDQTTARSMIEQYKIRAAAKGKAEAKELAMVTDAWLQDVAGKDLADCSEAECGELLKAIQAHYSAKKAS